MDSASPQSGASAASRVACRDAESVRLVVGHAGDHVLVHALLRAVNQTPSYEDFVTWLDEPTYEPADRLLIKRSDSILAHVQVLHRTAWFGGVKIPAGTVQDLAVLPEYAGAGYEHHLLSSAENAMRENQAVVSLVRTNRPEPFRAAGWIDARGQGYSEIAIGDVLAHLSAQHASSVPRRSRALRIRRWRHVELDAVRGIYASAAAGYWGALCRGEAYWRWLVGRKAHSDLIVAEYGDDSRAEPESAGQMVGYVVTQGAHILELCCLPEYARAAPRLLVRACQDAIEQDHHTISLHTPPSDPLHELVVLAGGEWYAHHRDAGSTLLVKLLDPARWSEAIYPILRRRVKRAGLARPLQLCFDTGDEQYRLLITRRSSRLVADETTPVDVRCDPTTFAALLLGNLNLQTARESAALHVADEEIFHRLSVLFPPAVFWQSQFDVLRF